MIKRLLVIIFFSIVFGQANAQVNQCWLDDLNISSFSEGIPGIATKTNAEGDAITINGENFSRGLGVKSVSILPFYLDGKGIRFTSFVGADDFGNPKSSMKFYVLGDRKILFESKVMKVGVPGEKVDVDVTGIRRLGLLVLVDSAFPNKVLADWADAQITTKDGFYPGHFPRDGDNYILTPKPSKQPKINTPEVFGATPGNPFFFSVAATGGRPMKFAASGLPNGLILDSNTGIITGMVSRKGNYTVKLSAKNKSGKAEKNIIIKIGDTICLTPPIGWNGWNSWAKNIDEKKVMSSAKAMVTKGLRDHGFTYINIDDAWQGQRVGKYLALQPNDKFPGFQHMVNYIHSLGLKIGLYSTPWIVSYAGYAGGSSDFPNGIFPDSIRDNKRKYRYIGKYRFETNDAKQMAEWGIDYLKYDWHIDENSAARMSEALKHSRRDIVYSLSNSAPFTKAADWERLANLWRTGSDIRDCWNSLYTSAFTLDKWAPYAGPGHWNDPDMLVVGNVSTGTGIHPTRLTADEQYSHVSIFCLLAAPLLIGCPLEQLDPFTLNLLTNDEVLAIDQDPLGKPARLLINENGVEVWVKPMSDGSYAVGLFNIDGFGTTPQSYFRWGDEKPRSFIFDFSKANLTGNWQLRDVWRQKNLGIFDDSFTTSVPHHGVVLLRMFPVK